MKRGSTAALTSARQMHVPRIMQAGELCIRTVVTALSSEPVVDVARRMAEHNVGDVIVVDEANGVRPIGVVTDRDLVVKLLTRNTCAPDRTRIAEVMRADVISALEDDDVETVLAKLRRHSIRRMPIVDTRGALQGIITLDDILGWMAQQLDVAVALMERQTEPTALA